MYITPFITNPFFQKEQLRDSQNSKSVEYLIDYFIQILRCGVHSLCYAVY